LRMISSMFNSKNFYDMEELIEILKKFEEERKKSINEHTWDEEAVAKCFKDNCAKDILCNGYFLVNNKYIIDLGAIELYYHEEKGSIKDYAMYHIPERYNSPKNIGVVYLEKTLPYFKLGSLNLHQSGVDVTFEKENEYRASFLIRAYRVFAANDKDLETKLKTSIGFDKCSTHIFDDMFYMGISFFEKDNTTIEWVKCTEKCSDEPTQCPRVNIVECAYDEDHKEVFKVDYKEQCYLNNTDLFTHRNGKVYKKDLRPWQFTIIK